MTAVPRWRLNCSASGLTPGAAPPGVSTVISAAGAAETIVQNARTLLKRTIVERSLRIIGALSLWYIPVANRCGPMSLPHGAPAGL
jgi:hypothetical protein